MISSILRSFFVNLNIRKFRTATVENVRDKNNYQNTVRQSYFLWFLFTFLRKMTPTQVPAKTVSQEACDKLLLLNTQDCEEKLYDLILLVTTCVVETSKEFRECMKEHLYILRAGRSYDVDKLIECQETAAKLKIELDKFERMIENMGQMAKLHSLALSLAEKPKAECNNTCKHINRLKEVAEEQYQWNRNWEADVVYKIIRMGIKDRTKEYYLLHTSKDVLKMLSSKLPKNLNLSQ